METPLFDQTSESYSYADVILPLAVPNTLTYQIPVELNDFLEAGFRVIVPLGNKDKIVTGVVLRIHKKRPERYKVKPLIDVLDYEPVISDQQLKLMQWSAAYYMSHLGEVLNAALPSGLKISSESRIQLMPEFSIDEKQEELSDRELQLLKALKQHETLAYTDLESILGIKGYHKIIKSLIEKRAILIFEQLKEKYKPKTVKKIRLASQYAEDISLLEELINSLEKRPKQVDVLLKYLQQVNVFQHPERNEAGVLKNSLQDVSASSLNTLINNKVLESFEIIVSRFEELPDVGDYEQELSQAQQKAKEEIFNHFEEKAAVLLHGVTGSGKTEIYIDLIQQALANGTQVLFLLPEIALTTQIVGRLRKVFGDKMGVYHSKFSDNERVEVWKGVLAGEFQFVVGVRSSVFLPFDNLGLIIIDEEHEHSYKQFDPAPRYHARDLALVLAHLHDAKTLLGSATPSVESYYNARSGKYGLVELSERFGKAQMPDLILTDIRQERKNRNMKGDFSPQFLEMLTKTLEVGDKAIVFQNRRGYAPFLTCQECAWVPQCHHCAVSLTYHQYRNELRCHYCGYKEKVPASCVACGSTRLRMIGFGTEKLEDDLKLLLPEAKVQRMDLDTTRKKYSYQKIIDDFANDQIDILVGTQMVSKGLDFEKVNLVGIVDADRIINFPDFRAHERAFQMITQVSGRAGRREKPGKVLIQTADTQQPVLQKVVNYDYFGMYKQEVFERKNYHYPPFVRLIRLSIRDREKSRCDRSATYLASLLRDSLGAERVLGPQEPLISKIRNQFRMEVMLKLPRTTADLKACKRKVQNILFEHQQQKDLKNSQVVVDVDPY